jgi:hypothetical protein
MLSSAFELGEKIKLNTLEYKLYSPLWSKYVFPASYDFSFSCWTSIKYLNDEGTELSEDVSIIPNDSGGLYLFYIKCPIIIGMTEFPFYIGRAQYADNQNLRKRCKEYFQKYFRNDERSKITKMFNYWSKDLYLAFLPLEENEDIKDLEKNIINSLLLPMNEEIPDIETRQAVKAF